MTGTFCPRIWGGTIEVKLERDGILLIITENTSTHGPTNQCNIYLDSKQAEALHKVLEATYGILQDFKP